MAGFLIQKVHKNFKIIIEESLIETFVEDLMPYAKFFGVTFHLGDESIQGHVIESIKKPKNKNSFLSNGSFDLEVEIIENKCEGMVRVKDIKGDYFIFDPEIYAMVGQKTKQKYQLGDPVSVQVKKANLEKRHLDFIIN